ncbi:MAG: DUF2066 domain-containing protein [Enhydrobacter sp.]|nr:MAG: DUF2066 domain-containing protein [Enhydrobacter sp.]
MAALAAGGAANAQISSGNTLTIGGIDVDVTGPDAVQARQQGIREAERRAAKLLVERMVAPEDRSKVPPLDDATLSGMVRGVEFARERTLPNRYIATLGVVFGTEPVKEWLRRGDVGMIETVARPALVIPLWKGKNGVEPLDDQNAWREAWRTLDTTGSAVPVNVVRGDQLDENALSVEEAFVGDVSALSRLNERYRAPTLVVAIVEGDKQTGGLTIWGLRYDAQTGARSELPRVQVAGEKDLADAAKKMHTRLDEEWRNVAVVRRDSQDALDVTVPIRGLADWVQVRQRLGAVPAVKGVEVRSLESDRADIRLEYYGTTDQLRSTLAQAGLLLDRDTDKWRLQPR